MSQRARRRVAGVLTVLVASGGWLVAASGIAAGSPGGAGHALVTKGGPSSQTAGAPLQYHGGKLLTASKTYAIFWGPQSQFPTDEADGMAKLLGGFGGSHYLGIAAQYLPVAPTSTYEGELLDSSPPPSHAPSTATIVAEVASLITTPDPNAIYFVYTSNFPHLNFCAWHGAGVINGVTVQVAYMPNTAGIAGCDPGNLYGANTYSEGTRSVADSTAHEFMEATTDPVPVSGWADKNHLEIGDKCNFVYGAPVELANHTDWQLQEEWSNAD